MSLRKSIFPLLLSILINSCNGQTANDLPADQSAPEPPATKAAEPQGIDPYFKNSVTTYTKYGPTGITRNILQDRKGDIWLATWEGIIRYDGTTFTNYTKRNYLRKFHVFSALEDRSGNLWFGTIGAGVYRYDGKTFTNITQKDGLAHDSQGCFHQDRSGNIWIGTMGGISIYDGETYRNITTEDGLPEGDINAILEDSSGKIWIASRGPLCTYDGKTFTPFRGDTGQLIPSFANKGAETFFNVRCVIEDRKGNIWFGGKDGLWCYAEGKLTQFAKAFTGYILEDSKGNIWTSSDASTGAGEWRVSRYNAQSLDNSSAPPEVILQKRDMFFGLTEDADGNIWVGSLNGVGRYDGEFFDWFRAGN